MANYGSQNAKCPFYLGGDDYRVKCEGTEKCNKTHIVFGSSKKKYRHFIEKCCKDYEGCRVYKMLDAKYDKKVAD